MYRQHSRYKCIIALINQCTHSDQVLHIPSMVLYPSEIPSLKLTDRELELTILAKYGLTAVLQAAEVNSWVPLCWPQCTRIHLLKNFSDCQTPDTQALLQHCQPLLTKLAQKQSSHTVKILGPPTGKVI